MMALKSQNSAHKNTQAFIKWVYFSQRRAGIREGRTFWMFLTFSGPQKKRTFLHLQSLCVKLRDPASSSQEGVFFFLCKLLRAVKIQVLRRLSLEHLLLTD